MKKIIKESSSSENPFAMSIGDLMAALLLIFVLLLVGTLLKLQNEFESKVNVAEKYRSVQEKLYNDLMVEFKDDLKMWSAEIDRNTLSVRFKEPEVLFKQGESSLNPKFVDILSNFFPRYIKVLTKTEYRNNIEEVRIEGHTSSEWYHKVNQQEAFFNNMRLSQDRTRSVLEFCFYQIQDPANRKWVQERITANGLSSSKLIFDNNGYENKDASRRVEFRIKTNAEQQIIKMINLGQKK